MNERVVEMLEEMVDLGEVDLELDRPPYQVEMEHLGRELQVHLLQ